MSIEAESGGHLCSEKDEQRTRQEEAEAVGAGG